MPNGESNKERKKKRTRKMNEIDIVYLSVLIISGILAALFGVSKVKKIRLTSEEKKEIKRNKILVKKYPFLLPRNRFTGKVSKGYNYSYTELDDMPIGWRNVFGEQMCEEVKEALGSELKEYRITQIKEKFGTLRWYDNGANQKVYDVISKYENLSATTCIVCGEPATVITKGWISPYCDEHSPVSVFEKNAYYEIKDGKIVDPERGFK
jgi:hypothetical protein